MKNLKKALVLLLCAILLVVGSVMGTLAYLTSQDTVKNTFINSTLLIIRHPGKTLLFMLFFATACFLVWLLPITIIIIPGIYMWQVSNFMEKIYLKYMSDEDKEFERRRYTPGDPHED